MDRMNKKSKKAFPHLVADYLRLLSGFALIVLMLVRIIFNIPGKLLGVPILLVITALFILSLILEHKK